MSLAVGIDPRFDGNGRVGGKLPLMAAFAVVGLILLVAALRLVRRRHGAHAHHYTHHHGR